jgi:hypothetical protein
MLKPVKLGLSGGIIWGLSMLFCTILAIYTGYSAKFLDIMANVYPGYSISWPGAFIGTVYGFLDGFFGLFLLGWLYNKLDR